MVTVFYDPTLTRPEALAAIIAGTGFRAEIVQDQQPAQAPDHRERVRAPLPEDAPSFFRSAFEEAQGAGRPMVIDFWATWCGPCQLLKEQTLADPSVEKALKDLQMIYVDLDEYPELGKAYGVSAVPDVFFVDRNGFIVDELNRFEPAESFLDRLRALIGE